MKRQPGFTLIELAIVVFLIGLIASMSFGAFKAQMINAAIRATQGNQEAVKDALMAYLAKNRRLPCPATSDVTKLGQEGRDTTAPPNCFTYYGLVPYQTLGLTKSTAMDGWDNFFSYGVSPQWTATYSTINDQYNTTSAANAFNVGVPGVITVDDMNQASGSAVPVTTTAAAVVISQGANGYGAYTSKGTPNDSTTAGASEKANILPSSFSTSAIPIPSPWTCNPISPACYKRDYTSNTNAQGGAFDDVVMVLNPSDLLTPLMRDGALKSAQGQWADQVANIKEWVVGKILSTSCSVPLSSDFPPSLATDPWGNTISSSGAFIYTRNILQVSSAVSAASTIYTLSNISANQISIQGPTVSWLQGIYQRCN